MIHIVYLKRINEEIRQKGQRDEGDLKKHLDWSRDFESPQGIELLATVHWLNRYEQEKSTEQVIQDVHSWNVRKQQFTPRQFTIVENVLDKQNWVDCVN